MILKSKLEGSSVEYKIGDRIGKMRDVVVDVTDPKWPVMGLMVSPGFGKGEVMVTVPQVVKLSEEDGNKLMVGPDALISKQLVDVSSRTHMKLDFIDNLPVLSSDGATVGKIYDVGIATSIRPWKASKLLVTRENTSHSQSAKLRLDVRHVTKVSDTGVWLDFSKDQVENLWAGDDNIGPD